jgi:hypothetical protein
MIIESSAIVHKSGTHRVFSDGNAVMNTRRKTANAAAFGPADMKALTGLDAP